MLTQVTVAVHKLQPENSVVNMWTFSLKQPLTGDHSPYNVKFPDDSRHSSAALGILSVTRIMPVLVLLSVVG